MTIGTKRRMRLGLKGASFALQVLLDILDSFKTDLMSGG